MRDDIEYMPLYGYNPLMYDYREHMRDDIEKQLMERYSYNDMTDIDFKVLNVYELPSVPKMVDIEQI